MPLNPLKVIQAISKASGKPTKAVADDLPKFVDPVSAVPEQLPAVVDSAAPAAAPLEDIARREFLKRSAASVVQNQLPGSAPLGVLAKLAQDPVSKILQKPRLSATDVAILRGCWWCIGEEFAGGGTGPSKDSVLSFFDELYSNASPKMKRRDRVAIEDALNAAKASKASPAKIHDDLYDTFSDNMHVHYFTPEQMIGVADKHLFKKGQEGMTSQEKLNWLESLIDEEADLPSKASMSRTAKRIWPDEF